MAKVDDLTGQRFGQLMVVKRVENGKHGDAMWLCRCDCGNEKIVRAGDLRRLKGTKSCGCLARCIRRSPTAAGAVLNGRSAELQRPFAVAECSKESITRNPHDTRTIQKQTIPNMAENDGALQQP